MQPQFLSVSLNGAKKNMESLASFLAEFSDMFVPHEFCVEPDVKNFERTSCRQGGELNELWLFDVEHLLVEIAPFFHFRQLYCQRPSALAKLTLLSAFIKLCCSRDSKLFRFRRGAISWSVCSDCEFFGENFEQLLSQLYREILVICLYRNTNISRIIAASNGKSILNNRLSFVLEQVYFLNSWPKGRS